MKSESMIWRKVGRQKLVLVQDFTQVKYREGRFQQTYVYFGTFYVHISSLCVCKCLYFVGVHVCVLCLYTFVFCIKTYSYFVFVFLYLSVAGFGYITRKHSAEWPSPNSHQSLANRLSLANFQCLLLNNNQTAIE